MIYNGTTGTGQQQQQQAQPGHQAPTLSSANKSSVARNKSSNGSSSVRSARACKQRLAARNSTGIGRCRGRCRVQWSEKHVKEGLVLVQEAQLARVVKTGPIGEHYDIEAKPFAR